MNTNKVTLREINPDNWRDCIKLKLKEEQRRFIGTNENGLALAYAHKEMQPRGIYNGEEMVGFLMYAKDPDNGKYCINRLMIDEKFQGKGFASEAMKILIENLRDSGAETLDIIHRPDNESAIRIYKKLGFVLTEETMDHDVVSRLKL